MEQLVIVPDNPVRFDAGLLGLKQASPMTVISKDGCTTNGSPGVMITFDVELLDGTRHPVQAVTTLKLFLQAAKVLGGVHGNE